MGSKVDKQTRSLLIRTNIALVQREVREQSNWYNTPRVAIRKRSGGKVILSRLGNTSAQNRSASDESEDYVLVECS
ncbi:hypothetical protein LQW54_008425 [Pestalotiopsis sp. IQ-011]|nr:hypothetical protein KJ359_013070 [Pestalotiopsis sp. 9143b]